MVRSTGSGAARGARVTGRVITALLLPVSLALAGCGSSIGQERSPLDAGAHGIRGANGTFARTKRATVPLAR